MLGHPGRNQEHFLDEKLLKLCAESAVKDLKSHLQVTDTSENRVAKSVYRHFLIT